MGGVRERQQRSRRGFSMHIAYLVITIFFASMAVFSGIGKIRRDAHQVRVIHETVGVPLKFFTSGGM
jgi:uncharacterized membrane protein YphA (DoxX/SURF4 family)